MTIQKIFATLNGYWAEQGCLLAQPYEIEVGAGTMSPDTFLRSLGPEPWNVAYVQPCRRPADSRYGENPNRLGRYFQYQVIMKPSPQEFQDLAIASIEALGVDPVQHDIRFVEDDWESPTLGASGVGWEMWLDGMEICQYTYFQQVGGLQCRPVAVELTYGPERLAMYLQGVEDYRHLQWSDAITYGELRFEEERQYSHYNLELADIDMLSKMFEMCEAEARRVTKAGFPLPAYDYVLKCSHLFNLLDARGAISVSERTGMIERVRNIASMVARAHVARREELGFPLLGEQGQAEDQQ
ncbi:MAG: glycine--tRNA ligase subunit alpha [candidate division WS1 bacterium]|jgi:glycyl-tRNA synthetase alpha chain|nr:glycine--tRNA ligase subunit alpha [candidate division WS1 bacterium]